MPCRPAACILLIRIVRIDLFDFYRELSVGDRVVYTDMEGNRYNFEISGMRYEKHADQAALQHEQAPLTLFIKNIYSFEYLIIFCDVLC